MERMAEASPRFKARIAGVFYLFTILLGIVALLVGGSVGFAAELIAGACYIAATLLVYGLFLPVNWSLALLAAFFSLEGHTVGDLTWQGVDIGMVAHGCYCL